MERSRDWLDDARGDLAHARSDLERGFYNWACFSAQQAAEKAAKAVLQRVGGEAWGFSVADLLAAFRAHGDVPQDLLDLALEMDKAYIAARYPNAHPAGSARCRYTAAEARRSISHADEIVRFCSDRLSALD